MQKLPSHILLEHVLIECNFRKQNKNDIRNLKLFTKMCILKFVRQLRSAGSPAKEQETQRWESLVETNSIALAPKGGKNGKTQKKSCPQKNKR